MGGEKQGMRDVIDRQTQRLVDHSGVKPAVAHQLAQESVRRIDQGRGSGKRRS